jgi:hypothetical protein
MPGTAAAVPRDTGDLGLMHRKDHGRRSARATEHIADVDDVRERRPPAAELTRHRDAEQPLSARSRDGLCREPRLAIDCNGMSGGDRRNLFRARSKILAVRLDGLRSNTQAPSCDAARSSIVQRYWPNGCTHAYLVTIASCQATYSG